MNVFQKVKTWFTSAGIRSLGYGLAAVGCLLFFGSWFFAGFFFGVFFADNINVIKELIKK